MWLLQALEFEKLFKSWNHVDVFESFHSDVLSLWIDDLGIDDLIKFTTPKALIPQPKPQGMKLPNPTSQSPFLSSLK